MITARDVILLYRTDFSSFVRLVFQILHPAEQYRHNWHIDVMVDALLETMAGRSSRLVINVPPRYLKSICASIALPLFYLAHNSDKRFWVCAGTRELGADFVTLRERVLQSPQFQHVFPHMRYTTAGDTMNFANGSRLSQIVVNRSPIGKGADVVVIDDPLAPKHAWDERRRGDVNEWYRASLIPRLNDKQTVPIILVMQRLHVDDLSGYLLMSNEPWRHIELSAIARFDEEWALSRGEVIRRRKFEPLFPAFEDKAELRRRLSQIDGNNFAAQYLQSPISTHNGQRPEWRTEFLIGWVPLGWKPGMGWCRGGLMKITPEHDIAHEYFGEPHILKPENCREMTDEEFEIDCKIRQAKLVAETRGSSRQPALVR